MIIAQQGWQPWLTVCRHGRLLLASGLLIAGMTTTPLVAAAPTHPATIDSFVAHSFSAAPAVQTLWLTPDIKAQAKAAAGSAPDGPRIRYWQLGNRTAWVLERIGKEAPITFGVVVEDGAVVGLSVLTYRESRGFEIQSTRWLAQFTGIRAGKNGLDRSVDNISGATLSVRASRDVTRLALFLHEVVSRAPARD